MLHRPINTSTIKYSVLKPTSQINFLKRSFAKPDPFCSYELAMTEQIGIRRYRQQIEQLDLALQDCQWRSQQKLPIVKCLYVQLLSYHSACKAITVQKYLNDLEVNLTQMKQLLLPQAVYLIKRAIEGYQAIWTRFLKVSVNQETIGLDCKGNCLVWMNKSLEKNHPEKMVLTDPKKIMKQIVSLIKSKCGPVCHNLLSRLLDSLAKKATFQEGLHGLNEFIKKYRINVPFHLKYIVNQCRLDKRLASLKNNSHGDKEFSTTFKAPKFVTSRTNLLEDVMSSKIQTKRRLKTNPFSTLRKTTSPEGNLMTWRSNNHPRTNDSYAQNRVSPIPFGKFNIQSLATRQFKTNSSHQRCKSQYIECIQVINNIRPKTKKQISTAREIQMSIASQKISGFSENAKTAESYSEIQSMKKIGNDRTPKQIIQSLNPCEQYQSYECSPFIIREDEPRHKSTFHGKQLFDKSDNNFHLVLQSNIIRVNQWTKTVRNLLQVESQLNKSITMGQDVNIQLSDIKLERLDTINKHLVTSLIPDSLH